MHCLGVRHSFTHNPERPFFPELAHSPPSSLPVMLLTDAVPLYLQPCWYSWLSLHPSLEAFLDGSFSRTSQCSVWWMLGSSCFVLGACHARPISTSPASHDWAHCLRDEVVSFRIPSCSSSTIAELCAILSVCMVILVSSSLFLYSGSAAAIALFKSICAGALQWSNRQLVRCAHCPLFRLLSRVLSSGVRSGSVVRITKVKDHQRSTTHESAATNWADNLAKLASSSAFPRKLRPP